MGDESDLTSTQIVQAVRKAVTDPLPDITEATLPVKVVAGLVCFVVAQCLTVAGVYYDLREKVNTIQDEAGAVAMVEMTEIKLKLSHLERDAKRIEKSMIESPTALDNMRRVGDLNADVRELKARVAALERE